MIGGYGLMIQSIIDDLNARGFLVVISQHTKDRWAVVTYRPGEMHWAHDYGSAHTLSDALKIAKERSLRRSDLIGKERLDWLAKGGRRRHRLPSSVKAKLKKRRFKRGLF